LFFVYGLAVLVSVFSQFQYEAFDLVRKCLRLEYEAKLANALIRSTAAPNGDSGTTKGDASADA
jgi:hypothetical protein